MKKTLTVIGVLLIGLLLFGCTGGGNGQSATQPTGTAQPTQQMQPSQEATASEQPTATTTTQPTTQEFTVPAGGVSPDDFCGDNAKSQELAQVINTLLQNTGFELLVGPHNIWQEGSQKVCSITVRDYSKDHIIVTTLRFSNQILDKSPICIPGTAPVPFAEIPNSCFLDTTTYTRGAYQYEIRFIKKNVEVVVNTVYLEGDRDYINLVGTIAKAVYEKV